ncbi:cytochrome P450 4c21 [Culex quinquefasciatus]|uniref:cytochrome P450 4c21 n=1 Tax=Culex quinquefasciatus TaxID=7176 RepID=UPI0018E3C6B4|nr:cytochrome P450 4c21 [Culex quinquefasciatus]
MFSLCLLGAIVLFLLYWKLARVPSYLAGIPRAQPWYPVLGNALLLVGKSPETFFNAVNALFALHNRLFQLWFGPRPVIGVSHPDLVEKVLTSTACLEKPYFYRFSRVDQGLWAASKTLWQSQRKAVNAAFSTRVLNDFIPTINECTEDLISQLTSVDGAEVNVLEYAIPCALKMVCGTTLGISVTESADMEEFIKSFNSLAEIVGNRFNTLYLQPDVVYRPTPNFREEMKHREKCYNFTKKILNEKKHQNSASSSKNSKIFIEHLLDNDLVKRNFSDTEIVQNAYSMIAAGSETTAYTIANACLLLALHPDVQNKLHSEITQIFPDAHPDISPQSLSSLHETESFLKELLRLYPIAPIIARETGESFELDGVRFPKGTIFLLNFYQLHRRQDLWGADSTRFNPDRFSGERSKEPQHSFAYLPFSGGPRNCIGHRYAMMTLKIMLVHLLRNFKLTTSLTMEDVKFKFAMLLTLMPEHSIRFERRN